MTASLLLLGLCWNVGVAMAQGLAIDMAPSMADAMGKPAPRGSLCEWTKDTVTLANATLRCTFSTADGHLALRSLYNELTAGEMLLQAGGPAIFVVEPKGKRFAGSRDFGLKSICRCGNGFEAILRNPELGMRVALRVSVDAEGLRLASRLENTGERDLDFHVAFPCIDGLKLSNTGEDDYYYFPWGGGVISTRPTVMRLGYGDSQALWQIMDVFRPARGAGVYLRVDDDRGFYRTMSLRKFTAGQPEQAADQYMRTATKPEYLWKSSSLEQREGTSLAIEYRRRTRAPGRSFEPPPAVLATHAGNWKTAMSVYAAWAHKVWKWRPYPSKLKSVAVFGIGSWPDAPLFVNGKYRDDFLKPGMEAVELCCWWDWSTVGPGGVPFDKLSPEQLKKYGPYMVKDPVSGKAMFMGSPTDYAGYNDRFGGLDAFRKAIASNRRKDKLITLYTDPFRLDEFSNETGKKYGKKWSFVDSTGRRPMDNAAVRPCHLLPEVQDWLDGL